MKNSIICRDYNGKEYTFNEKDYIDHLSVYGIIVSRDRLLLVEHSVSKRWEFPGGGLEGSEDIYSALSREIKEETDLVISGEITLMKSIIEYYYDLGVQEPWRSVRNFYTISSYSGGLRRGGNNDDVSQAAFIERKKLEELQLTPTIKSASFFDYTQNRYQHGEEYTESRRRQDIARMLPIRSVCCPVSSEKSGVT